MATVIAARLQLQDQVDEAIGELERAGFAREHIASFYVNPPGQHATYPIGGDRFESPGIKDAGEGAAKGAGAAAVAGAAAGAVFSPAGAVVGGLVGAHAGSLVGSLSHSKEKGETESKDADDPADATNTEPLRRAGMLIAVEITGRDQAQALDVLKQCGAFNAEKAEGEIIQGQWRDFDPLVAPQYV